MGKDTKLVHFSIVGGTDKEIRALGIALNKLKSKLPMDIQFLVTNDKIELHSVKYLINELIKLYRQEKCRKKDINKQNNTN